MQSVAKPRILSPHVKLQEVSIWKNMETFRCVIPLALIAAATQQKQWYTSERAETVALFYYWIYWIPFIPIPCGREWGSAFATKPRPKLPTCLVKMLLLANHPTLKLRTPCPKQRTDVERQHCMRKILFVSLVSNLSGALTCATMQWELIRVSQELLFLIGCSAGSKMKEIPRDLGVWKGARVTS